ncbi:MAG: IS1634 family transposase [Acidobacteriaceae bacterium]
MYIRTKRVYQNGRWYEYLLIVEAARTSKGPRQKTIANLGRKDLLDPSEIDKLVRSMAPLAQRTLILDPLREDEGYQGSRLLGALPVFRRLFEDLGVGPFLREANRTDMPLDRAVFAMVAARLIDPLSKLRTFAEWLPSVYAPDLEDLRLHHLYRALDLLAQSKDALEQTLWQKTRGLFNPAVDLVLVDTTNTYVEGDTRGDLAQYGKSKERRYDRRLLSIGVLVTGAGIPIGHEVFPGNLHDARAFTRLVSSLGGRFSISRVILCADRGMVSEQILKGLREAGLPYVVGCRMTRAAERAISDRAGVWRELEGLPVRIKPLRVEGEWYVVCHNWEEAEREKARRQEIITRLRAVLKHNPSGSALLRNTSFRPYVRVRGKLVAIDAEALKKKARTDGKYVLRSSAELSPEQIFRAYRQLYQVERVFRAVKGPLELRPIRHFTDRRIRGHVMVCFLAYALEMALRQAMGQQHGGLLSEHDYRAVMTDLGKLSVATLIQGDRHYEIRSQLGGRAFEAFSAVGLRPPPRVLKGPADSGQEAGL